MPTQEELDAETSLRRMYEPSAETTEETLVGALRTIDGEKINSVADALTAFVRAVMTHGLKVETTAWRFTITNYITIPDGEDD